jgi:hypothetical protein
VDKYGGSCNKNIGEAFLLAWKFKDEDLLELGDDLKLRKTTRTQAIADLAVFSFVKVISKINKYEHILHYKNDPLLNSKIRDYSVKMGFGLHFGWAIEGAIGSNFKIDASYLSPNVNIAARLDAATKQYGVQMLISGELIEIMSERMANVCREIDCVAVKGSV